MRTPRVASATTAALLALVLGLPAVGHAAEAVERCSGTAGVTVVVDYGPLEAPRRGAVAQGCDPAGAETPAATVITRAGFSVTYAVGQPFVCRVEGRPTPAMESCDRTPPGDAYWGLFWSDGSSARWQYSTAGAATLTVPEGGAVGLRFQDGGEREEPRARPASEVIAGPAPERRSDDLPDPGDDTAMTLVAGGAVLVLAGAAGVIGWRRRA